MYTYKLLGFIGIEQMNDVAGKLFKKLSDCLQK